MDYSRLKIKLFLLINNLDPKVIGSEFKVQARPGATGCVSEIVLTLYGIGFPSPHLDMPGLGQGFKGYKMLTPITL
jgi:hypothetical protein